MKLKEKLTKTLIKKATGYQVEESVCEYGVEDSEVKLIKKKVSTKYYAPDLNAINILLNEKQVDYQNLSDEELEQEKERILNLLKQLEKEK